MGWKPFPSFSDHWMQMSLALHYSNVALDRKQIIGTDFVFLSSSQPQEVDSIKMSLRENKELSCYKQINVRVRAWNDAC